MTESAGRPKKRKRFAVRVTYANGNEAWLRHGAKIGCGPIVEFRDRTTADINRDMVQQGLNDGDTAMVVTR